MENEDEKLGAHAASHAPNVVACWCMKRQTPGDRCLISYQVLRSTKVGPGEIELDGHFRAELSQRPGDMAISLVFFLCTCAQHEHEE
jgi:hypothetical protein